MSTDKPPVNTGRSAPKKAPQSREDRLKAALKANMGRRKAQARARAASGAEQDKGQPE
ncbi:hypothetical protein [Nioella sp. MMSF_3534]|jgi:hypothetical protein|uniref:hypothetical protein n=1 Tax=Nioella sp. MMSF_3534 TaxID=3046720 RepID=UPI00273ED82F|nr:hypothetical protein [Nioella sp. MMSF_3534]